MASRNFQKKEDILIDQKNRKIVFCSWIPQKTLAQLIIVHGFSEHMRCYETVATHLAEMGIAVHMMDLPGHGLSDGARGHVDDFQSFVDNITLFFRAYPNFMKSKPVFLLGHSLGGLIAAHFGLQHGSMIDGLILSSPLIGFPTKSVLTGKLLTSMFIKSEPDKLVPKPMNPKALSRNKLNWEKYRSDPLRNHTLSPLLFSQMVTRYKQIARRASEIDLPVLTFYSKADRVVSPDATRRFMDALTVEDKTQVVYSNAMHELLQEEEMTQIAGIITDWIEERV